MESSDYVSPFKVAILFHEGLGKAVERLIKDKIEDKGFRVTQSSLKKQNMVALRLRDCLQFLQEAERLKIELKKPVKKQDHLDQLGLSHDSKLYRFKSILKSLNKELQESERFSKFTVRDRHKFKKEVDMSQEGDYHKYIDLFSSGDQIKVCLSMLNKVTITPEEKASYNIQMADQYIIKNFYYHEGLIEDIIPLHDKHQVAQKMSVAQLRNYHGDTVAQYFYFVTYMQKWLWKAALMGCIAMFMNWYSQEDTEHSPWDSIYSFAMIIWANCFCAFWQRHEKKLQILWRCEAKQIDKNILRTYITIIQAQAKEKNLKLYRDPVTGKEKVVFSSYVRYLRYFQSFLVTVPLVMLSFGVLILSLNFRGYTDPKHIIYIESVTQYSEPGRMFDKNTNMATVSSVMHSIVMLIINIYYSEVSQWLTQREMHTTKQDFNSSLITKRFFFETFNTFTDIAYLGFIQMDITLLKQELLSYYMTDEVRRLITESLIPYFQKKQIRHNTHSKKLERTYSEEERQDLDNIKIEVQLPKYEQFDDYLEIVINFGYITLFASAFPLAPLLTLLFHWMELESDKWKIMNVYQRPVPYKQSGIGSWLNVLNIMSVLAILTNIFLFAFASHKITEFFPSLFLDDHSSSENSMLLAAGPTAKLGKGRYVIAVVFIIENLMFLAVYIIRNYVKYCKSLDWVDTYERRKMQKLKINTEKKKELQLQQSSYMNSKMQSTMQ